MTIYNHLPDTSNAGDWHYLNTTSLDTALRDACDKLTAIEESYLADAMPWVDRTVVYSLIDDLRVALATIEARAKGEDA